MLVRHSDPTTDPDCPVEWIITKSALQEGWDCPFAYVLVSLSNTKSKQAMTQLVHNRVRILHREAILSQAATFSWQRCVDETIKVYREAIAAPLVDESTSIA